MDNKKHNALLIILLVVFIFISLALGGFVFYDKVLKNHINSPIENLNNRDYDDDDFDDYYDDDDNYNYNGNNNYISKINPTQNWIHDAQYEKNVLANSYDTYYDTYYAKDIIAPFININSNDATMVNEEIKGVFDEAINRYNEGVENITSFVTINYEKFIDNNIASVNFSYGKGGTDVIRPDYYTYTFDLTTGKIMSFEELYQKFGFNKNQIDMKIKEEITDEVNDIFEDSFRNENSTNYINESINNYEKNLEDNTLRYFVNDDGELCIIARLSIPAGAGYQDTILEID